MRLYSTEVLRVPKGEIYPAWFIGPVIKAINWEDAVSKARELNEPAVRIEGRLCIEVPCHEDHSPIWDEAIDHDKPIMN